MVEPNVDATSSPLQVGSVAPDFSLRDQHGQTFSLAGERGRRAVLLVFYPFAFSGVCSGELTGFRDHLGDFETDDSTVMALSCDPIFALRAYADRDAVFFPLLSDFWPHGATATAYGVFDPANGAATRSSFVVDKTGKISWAVHHEIGAPRELGEQAARLRAAADG